jgi:hypothetical protein
MDFVHTVWEATVCFTKYLPQGGSSQRLLLVAANRILPADITSHQHGTSLTIQQHIHAQHSKTFSSATLRYLTCYHRRLHPAVSYSLPPPAHRTSRGPQPPTPSSHVPQPSPSRSSAQSYWESQHCLLVCTVLLAQSYWESQHCCLFMVRVPGSRHKYFSILLFSFFFFLPPTSHNHTATTTTNSGKYHPPSITPSHCPLTYTHSHLLMAP